MTPQTFGPTCEPEFCQKLLAAMSNRRVTHPDQVIDRLIFQTTDSDVSDTDVALRENFQSRLIRWLCGIGHPLELRGTYIPEDVFEREKTDRLVRAKLLLRAVTDSDLLLVSGEYTIKAGSHPVNASCFLLPPLVHSEYSPSRC